MRIEQPETHDAPAQPDLFETLGQFYHALENGLEAVAADFDIFSNPQTGLQLSNPEYYQPVAFDAEDSGGLIRIENLETAIATIEIIVHQGEGVSNERWADPDHQELTHYFKLLSIFDGSTPLGKVRNVARNPSRKDLPPLLHPVTDLFNALYRGLYLVMDRLFSPDVNQGRAVGVLYLLMADVLSQVGRFLVSQRLNDNEFAGPTFEVFDFGDDGPIAELTELSSRAAESFPELSTVHEALHGLSLIL
jgi:hypothetical protein